MSVNVNCFTASILELIKKRKFVNVVIEMNVNINNEHNFSDVYPIVNLG